MALGLVDELAGREELGRLAGPDSRLVGANHGQRDAARPVRQDLPEVLEDLHRLRSGVALGHVSAHTVSDDGAETLHGLDLLFGDVVVDFTERAIGC